MSKSGRIDIGVITYWWDAREPYIEVSVGGEEDFKSHWEKIIDLEDYQSFLFPINEEEEQAFKGMIESVIRKDYARNNYQIIDGIFYCVERA